MLKVEWRVLAGLGAFLAPLITLYWFASYEHAGSVLLSFFAISLLFVGLYLAVQGRRGGPRPEDRTDATPEEAAGDVGYFPTGSVWPLTIGAAATLIAAGLVFSGWLALPGLALLLGAAVGYMAEALRR